LRGYEAGRIAARIELLGHLTIRETISRDNEALVRELAKRAHRPYRAELLNDGLLAVRVGPVSEQQNTGRRSADTNTPESGSSQLLDIFALRHLAEPSRAWYRPAILSFPRPSGSGRSVDRLKNKTVPEVDTRGEQPECVDGNGSQSPRTSRSLRVFIVAPVGIIKSRLERRYVELVPRHLRELAEANDFPTPNRYIPAAEAEPIIYPEDARVYAESEPFYSEPNPNGDGTRKNAVDAGSNDEEAASRV
jgi:hypothetical protein